MSAAAELLDLYKKARSIPTDMALAENLGKTRALVSAWRAGKAQPQEAEVEKMCRATGEDEGVWLTLLAAERAETPAARVSLLRLVDIAKKYGHAACVTLAAAVALLSLRHGIDAHGVAAFSLFPSIHYAKSKVRPA